MASERQIKETGTVDFPTFSLRMIAAYMVSYLIAGIIAQMYYVPIWGSEWGSGTLSAIMRPMDSPWVALGPALQAVNAFFISLVLYPFRSLLLGRKNGWALLFLLVAGFSIFVPQAPAPGSFEGFLYTKLTVFEHLVGLPETLMFSFLFSFGFWGWNERPRKLWNVLAVIAVSLIVVMSTLGYLAAVGILVQPS